MTELAFLAFHGSHFIHGMTVLVGRFLHVSTTRVNAAAHKAERWAHHAVHLAHACYFLALLKETIETFPAVSAVTGFETITVGLLLLNMTIGVKD